MEVGSASENINSLEALRDCLCLYLLCWIKGMQLMTNVRRTDDKNQIFIVCLYLTTFFRAGSIGNVIGGWISHTQVQIPYLPYFIIRE